ncbi:MAG: histidine phosphatase family protein [Ilumatobacteraceae bacterium]
MPTPVPSLLVIRHGQSLWNALARWQGMADIDLSDLGRTQAQVAAEHIADGPHGFHRVFASHLSRARETASIIAAHLNLDAPQIDERWNEADAGPWQGLTPDEIKDQWPGFLERNRRPDGFESYDNVVERSLTAATELLTSVDPDQPLLVVSHSGVIRSLRRHLTGASERTPNLGGMWLHLVNGRVRAGHTFDPLSAAEEREFSEGPGPVE